VARTLLKAFLDNTNPFPTHYGAISGITVMGSEVVRALILPNLKIYSEILLQPALKEGDLDAEKVLGDIMV
jgi:transcription initiation factor TFIID subunit 6